jgi:urease accessory protein
VGVNDEHAHASCEGAPKERDRSGKTPLATVKIKRGVRAKIRRQQPIGDYIVDFVCLEKMLIIEVDGGQHAENENDRRRDAWLQSEGYTVLRFWNNDVLGNLGGVMERICEYCGAPSPQSPPLQGGEEKGEASVKEGEGKPSLKGRERTGKQYLGQLLFAFLLLVPASAFAHVEGGQASGLITGVQHPWSGLDHVLAMIAVGIWGAQLGNPALWLLPVTFPMVMAMGAMFGLLGIPLPGVEIGIALSAILLGAMVVGEVRPQMIIAALLVGFFAIFHGHAHGTELPPGQSGLLYSMGFVIATGCLHGIGIALGLVHRWPAGKLALRGAGACIAGMGMAFLWRALA